MTNLRAKSTRWVTLMLLLAITATAVASQWKKLAEDGIHDPKNPALKLLQNPEESLSLLPPDSTGNRVDWIRALQNGDIKPRSNIYEQLVDEVLDMDVLIQSAGSVPIVRFRHKPHTEWLDCSNCHEDPFKSKAGATEFSMLEILKGEFCGTCHGAVSFPLTECDRCHSVSPEEFLQIQQAKTSDGVK